MGYAAALEKAWSELAALTDEKSLKLRFISDEYDIDLPARTIISTSLKIAAKDYTAIIILHYLIRKLKLRTLPEPRNEWIEFNRLEGGDAYYPVFKKRTIGHILKKFGKDPDGLIKASERFASKRIAAGDIGIVFEPLKNVPVLITLWKADEEFGPEANILFDRTVSGIFCTEDIVVLTELLIHSL